MSEIVTESERQRRVERMETVKHALRGGMNVEQRTQAVNVKADRWCAWFRRRMDQGADPMTVLPDALAELEQRITDETVATVKELRSTIRKALG
jgi:hypothetical protein